MQNIFFDLDGTLLPMEMDVFLKEYFGTLCEHARAVAEPTVMKRMIYRGVEAMMRNLDPALTCEDVFAKSFEADLGVSFWENKPLFLDYYENHFGKLAPHFPPDPRAAQCVLKAKEKGCKCALATNPIFPAAATLQRIKWAGLERGWFEHVTTYEDCSFTKPNPEYFLWLMDYLGWKPEDCRMVGNDELEDIRCAQSVGIECFFLENTPLYINGESCTTDCARGGFDELLEWI
ncbi:MAG: HAD hydrolase-like protein [Clostridia bacterium]|nr:HAD hydrolase-like protein [Clostridia bacterium]